MATTDATQDKEETANPYLTVAHCLICEAAINEMGTAVYSRRNKAFLHYECRDRVLAERAEADRATAAKAKKAKKRVGVGNLLKPVSGFLPALSPTDSRVSTLGETCEGCGQPVDLSEECWLFEGKARHTYCRPSTAK